MADEKHRITPHYTGDSKKGKQWMKLISKVDRSKINGYAFEGEFLREQEYDFKPGDVVLKVGFEGSWKNGELTAHVYQINLVDEPTEEKPERKVWKLEELESFSYVSQFLSLRDFIADLVEKATAERSVPAKPVPSEPPSSPLEEKDGWKSYEIPATVRVSKKTETGEVVLEYIINGTLYNDQYLEPDEKNEWFGFFNAPFER